MNAGNERAAVLIITLWIVTIISALCISVAHRSAITLKLSSYQTDKVKAYFVARAGIFRALAQKSLEYERQRSHTIDAFSQPWANNAKIFKNFPFAEGAYTVAYGREPVFYGLSDEASRLNINKASPQMLTRLINLCGADEGDAEEAAYCIVDWRDKDDVIGMDLNFEKVLGAENEYYQELDNPYPCKNSDFEMLEELLLVKGVTLEIFYGKEDKKGKILPGLKDFLTVYTKGEVNINTAPEEVLSALFAPGFEGLAEKIAFYRKGSDGIAGTKDDRWFSSGTYVIERGEEGMVDVKNLYDGDWLGNAYGIDRDEYARIKKLAQGKDGIKIQTHSNVYRAKAEGEVGKVISRIEAVYEFVPGQAAPAAKFWCQN